MIVVTYETLEMARACLSLELAQAWLGSADAQSMIDLIADIEAMTHAAEAIDFYGAEISGPDSLSIAFSPRYGASFEAVKPVGAVDGGGNVVWAKQRRILLKEIKEL